MKSTVFMRDITMSFGSNDVLRGVNLEVVAGEVTALLGANGAGKSTLIKVLAGVYPQHGGAVEIDGMPTPIPNTIMAHKAGIHTVHQRVDDGIVPGLTVAENLLFEQIARNEISRIASIRTLLPKARAVASALELDWDDAFLRRDVFELGIADRQMLVLTRALHSNPRLLVLDEPTSALSAAEVERLFDVIRSLRARGVGVLYVSHRLGEIDTLADQLVVLRDGRIRGEQERPFDWEAALRHMLGEQVVVELESLSEQRGEREVLELTDVRLFPRSKPFDLTVRAGEVTGVIGLLGSGKSELANGVFGGSRFVSGSMQLEGKPYQPKSPGQAIRQGVFLVPEDRAAESMLPAWSIARTASLPFLSAVSSGGVLKPRRENARGRDLIADLGVVAQSETQDVDALSGGNQQKVVVGRWLQGEPRLLLLDEPFRGVDIGARRTISTKAREVAGQDIAVVVLTSDIDEVLEVADRVVVLVDGDVRMDSYSSQTNRDEIVARMSEVA